MSMTELNKIRIQAIDIVNSYKSVLSDYYFVGCMKKATIATIKEGASLSIKEYLFDKDLKNIEHKMKQRTEMFTVLMDESAPKNVKLFYVENVLGRENSENWDSFKNSFK